MSILKRVYQGIAHALLGKHGNSDKITWFNNRFIDVLVLGSLIAFFYIVKSSFDFLEINGEYLNTIILALIFLRLSHQEFSLKQLISDQISVKKDLTREIRSLGINSTWNSRLLLQSNRELESFVNKDNLKVNFIIELNNSIDYRIINCLRSIRSQSYNQEFINITILDLRDGITLSHQEDIKELSSNFKTQIISRDTNYEQSINKSALLNEILKKRRDDYTIIADSNSVFRSNFVDAAIQEIRLDPLQVITAKCFKLNDLVVLDNFNLLENYWFGESVGRLLNPKDSNEAPFFIGNFAIRLIGGFNMSKNLEGYEHHDLRKRLTLAGFSHKYLENSTSTLIQPEPRFRVVKEKRPLLALQKKNRSYLNLSRNVFNNNSEKILP